MVLTQAQGSLSECMVIENELKSEYGDDFRTNREKFPLSSQTLTYLASTPCEEHFGYSGLVSEYCKDVNHFPDQIGNGQTCADRVDRSVRSQWCLQEADRLKNDAKCSSSQLDNLYHSTAASYCQTSAGQKDKWCACYNLKNKVCTTNAQAAGCEYHKQLDDNKTYFKDGYDILKNKAHCRPRSCDSGYIPENVKSDCEPSYRMCEKDINIQSSTNNNIIVECNGPGQLVLPDWWDEEFDESFFDDDREPPFDTFPLNKLPITRFPKKFVWKNKNVRYLTYTGVSSVSSCCLCLMLIMLSLKRR